MSNEYNEQIKEMCLLPAEWEALKFCEDMVDKKAKELYEQEEQTSFLYKKNWGMDDD